MAPLRDHGHHRGGPVHTLDRRKVTREIAALAVLEEAVEQDVDDVRPDGPAGLAAADPGERPPEAR